MTNWNLPELGQLKGRNNKQIPVRTQRNCISLQYHRPTRIANSRGTLKKCSCISLENQAHASPSLAVTLLVVSHRETKLACTPKPDVHLDSRELQLRGALDGNNPGPLLVRQTVKQTSVHLGHGLHSQSSHPGTLPCWVLLLQTRGETQPLADQLAWYTNTHVFTYIYSDIAPQIHTYIYTNTQTLIYIYIYTRIHTHIHI